MIRVAKTLADYTQRFVGRPWYPLLVAALNGADTFILIVPNDALMVSAILPRPRYWLRVAITCAVGSSLGALLMAYWLYYDAASVQALFPALFESRGWESTAAFLHDYGYIAAFLGAVGPVPLPPFVIVGALAEMHPVPLVAAVLAGRLSKYIVLSWCTAKAPGMLTRIWEMRLSLPYLNKKKVAAGIMAANKLEKDENEKASPH